MDHVVARLADLTDKPLRRGRRSLSGLVGGWIKHNAILRVTPSAADRSSALGTELATHFRQGVRGIVTMNSCVCVPTGWQEQVQGDDPSHLGARLRWNSTRRRSEAPGLLPQVRAPCAQGRIDVSGQQGSVCELIRFSNTRSTMPEVAPDVPC